MAEEKKTPASGQKPDNVEAKKKAPAKKDDAEKTVAKAKPANEKSAEKKAAPKKRAAPKKPAGRKPAEEKAAPAKEAAEPKAAPKRKPRQAEPVPVIVRASARYVRIAPRKARLVADQVRGLQIDRARALLDFSPRNAARDIRKLIDSAASNAENNHELVADDMRIAEIKVDEGPTLRRYRPRALGRATKINKRTSHISVALTPED
jgi:ribosomal protein L22